MISWYLPVYLTLFSKLWAASSSGNTQEGVRRGHFGPRGSHWCRGFSTWWRGTVWVSSCPSLLRPEGNVGRKMVLVAASALEPMLGHPGELNLALAPIHLPTAPLVPLPMPASSLCQAFYIHSLNPGAWMLLATSYRWETERSTIVQNCASVGDIT